MSDKTLGVRGPHARLVCAYNVADLVTVVIRPQSLLLNSVLVAKKLHIALIMPLDSGLDGSLEYMYFHMTCSNPSIVTRSMLVHS